MQELALCQYNLKLPILQGTGLIQPGEQLTQLLFAAAAQLTSMMVGATSLSREGTGKDVMCMCEVLRMCADS